MGVGERMINVHYYYYLIYIYIYKTLPREMPYICISRGGVSQRREFPRGKCSQSLSSLRV